MSFSPRTSPFKRPDSPASNTPSTVRAASPAPTMAAPSRTTAPPSPTRGTASPLLGEQRQSPFVRRPSQLGLSPERSKSPFSRAPSRLSVAETPSDNEDPFVVNNSTTASSTLETSARSSPALLNPMRSPPLAQSTAAPPLTRRETASTVATVRPTPTPSAATFSLPTAGTGYKHVPAPLLASMRESFEVLDPSSTNTIRPADLAAVLEQLGLDAGPASVAAFFPAGNGSAPMTLSRFLDGLTAPMRELSEREELLAAFGAFDVDDSGQIDLRELREAVLGTLPEGGYGARLSEREVDGILGEFAGRRAFGAKGVSGKEIGGGRGEVFKYKDFMTVIAGGNRSAEATAA